MNKPIRILGIAGSLRRESYNRAALRAMRAGGDRLSAVVSARDCRCSRFVLELGLEVFRHHWPSDCKAVAPDQRIFSRQTRPLLASASSLPPGQHFVFLRGELRSARTSCRSEQTRSQGPRRNRSRPEERRFATGGTRKIGEIVTRTFSSSGHAFA